MARRLPDEAPSGHLPRDPARVDLDRTPAGGPDGPSVWYHRNEQDRLASLASYRILDTDPEPPYDAVARLAAAVLGAPAAMVTLIDEDRQWCKAVHGLPTELREVDRAVSFCSDAVALESPLVVEDAPATPRYAANALVTGQPGIRAYAGVPLIGRDGLPIGALCVLDWRRRTFSRAQLDDLAALAGSVVTHLELRRVDRTTGRDPGELLADALDPRRLRAAIDRGELVNRYQPILDMSTGEPYAFEALVRWNHPELGVIPPALFLPAMERTGLMHALGRAVLAGALDLVTDLRGTSLLDWSPKVAVNVSGTQLMPAGLAASVADALSERRLDPDVLCVEVTESVPVQGAAVEELGELHRLGVGIALDDYGAGTATAGKVLDLPLTALKLDRSLAGSVHQSSRSHAVVRSTFQMAGQIGLEVICEGIETTDQLQALVALGATLGQGWLFSPPLGANHVAPYLAVFRSLRPVGS
ncbi:MAG: EAL domain-containing protein [Actinomycetota bacterium]|nr:EAL domain-containing protein [Actinomycetota bacterium]